MTTSSASPADERLLTAVHQQLANLHLGIDRNRLQSTNGFYLTLIKDGYSFPLSEQPLPAELVPNLSTTPTDEEVTTAADQLDQRLRQLPLTITVPSLEQLLAHVALDATLSEGGHYPLPRPLTPANVQLLINSQDLHLALTQWFVLGLLCPFIYLPPLRRQ